MWNLSTIASRKYRKSLSRGVSTAYLHVGDQTIPVVRIPGHMEALVQFAKCRRRRRPAQVREDEEPLAGNRSLFLDDPEGGFHVLREAGRFGRFVQAQIRFGAVRPVLRNREAFGEQPAPVKPFERTELLHPEPGGEVGPQPSEGLGRLDWVGEPGVGGDPLLRQREREEVGRVEVPRDDRTVSEEIGEPDEARSSPVR